MTGKTSRVMVLFDVESFATDFRRRCLDETLVSTTHLRYRKKCVYVCVEAEAQPARGAQMICGAASVDTAKQSSGLWFGRWGLR